VGVPFIDIKRFEPGFLEKWAEKVHSLSQNAQFIGGQENFDLEKTLSEWTGKTHSIACANGTDAIQIALRAVGVDRGDKVLLPDSTFWATFESVVNCGADPYTVDTSPDDLQMEFSEFEAAIDKVKPKAAILVHLYGWGSSKVEAFRSLCQNKGIPLVEDGAQCFGVKYKGEALYKKSLIATTSFYPAKVLGAAGDGGAIFTSDPELADKSRKLANHGRTSHYEHGSVGWNSRLDSLQAAFLNLSLEHLPMRIASRRKAAEFYYQNLPKLGIKTVHPPEGFEENGYCNVTLFSPEERPKIESVLKEKGIGFANIYPGAMSDQPGAKQHIQGRFGSKEEARRIAKSVLNFPLFAYMKEEELSEVLQVVQSYYKS